MHSRLIPALHTCPAAWGREHGAALWRACRGQQAEGWSKAAARVLAGRLGNGRLQAHFRTVTYACGTTAVSGRVLSPLTAAPTSPPASAPLPQRPAVSTAVRQAANSCSPLPASVDSAALLGRVPPAAKNACGVCYSPRAATGTPACRTTGELYNKHISPHTTWPWISLLGLLSVVFVVTRPGQAESAPYNSNVRAPHHVNPTSLVI
jgi:hypothetical protein